MIHDEAHFLIAAGAVLDDLAPDETAAYETHRASCPECRRVELELDHVVADLALVVPERMPPAELILGIRRALAADEAPFAARPASPVPATTSNLVPIRRTSRGPLYASLALAAGLGVVALGLGARSLTLQQDLDAANAQVASLEQSLATRDDAMTVAMNPQHVTVALHAEPLAPAAEAAVVYVPGAAQSWIVARNLPATPAGHGYQLWYADGSGVHPLQTVSFDGTGVFAAPIGVDLAGSAAVMITLELDGGATGEPGPQVIFGEL
jgi:hypothetical protein